jgi:ketosteroid isomerase-like protein
MSDENVEVVEELFEAIGRGEVELALQYVRSDGEWVNPDNAMEPGTRRGLDGVRTALAALRDSCADLRFDISQMVDLGDRVLVTGTFSGVGRASGARFGPQNFGSVVTLADGKVKRYQWYLDPNSPCRREAEVALWIR